MLLKSMLVTFEADSFGGWREKGLKPKDKGERLKEKVI
jgi:hypothetical protein